jgi:hypothetical protein
VKLAAVNGKDQERVAPSEVTRNVAGGEECRGAVGGTAGPEPENKRQCASVNTPRKATCDFSWKGGNTSRAEQINAKGKIKCFIIPFCMW